MMSKHDSVIKRLQSHGIRVDPECVTESGQLLDEAIALLQEYGAALENIAYAELGAIPDANAADFQMLARDTIEE